MRIRELSRAEYQTLLGEATTTPPIEQTMPWLDYQATIEGRTPWGQVAFEREDGTTCAVAAFVGYATHGYHYLRSTHGPVWAQEPTAQDELDMLETLRAFLKRRDRKVAFVRLSVAHESYLTHAVLSTTPYDRTVVVSLEGGDEDILSRMKPRGRRDVRKALRESPSVCTDETELGGKSFDEYYAVMEETAQRDGFAPAPKQSFEQLLRVLGPEHSLLIVSRVDGRVVSWGIATMSGARAAYYYAASCREAQKLLCVDKQMMCMFQMLAERGIREIDLMGIGSEFSPALMGLNGFKTKFSKEVVRIAPERDMAVKQGVYRLLTQVRDVRDAHAQRVREREEERTPDEPRDDVLPVILGGDIGVYALGREFHEAYGVKSVCIIPEPIKAIELSAIFELRAENPTPDNVLRIVNELAQEHPQKKVVVVANTDAYVKVLEKCVDGFADNVYCPLPSREVVDRVSNKASFAELCVRYGLDTPRTEVVSLAGDEPIAPSQIDFPLVAKPADSATFFPYHYQGFRKAYCIASQDELDDLWRRLREAGFAGEFLVQEMIEGDDTSMDVLTVYVNQAGKPTMYACMQVLLQDHAPTMIGNYVGLVTRPRPELWEKVGTMLAEEGYRGFANFDIKHDRKTGRTIFLDFNPRVGRASYSVCASGVNPMRVLVSDVVDGRGDRVLKADEPAVYSLVPKSLLLHYLVDDDLRAEVTQLMDDGRAFDPQEYWPERDPRRAIFVLATKANHQRKFAANYPEASDTSF